MAIAVATKSPQWEREVTNFFSSGGSEAVYWYGGGLPKKNDSTIYVCRSTLNGPAVLLFEGDIISCYSDTPQNVYDTWFKDWHNPNKVKYSIGLDPQNHTASNYADFQKLLSYTFDQVPPKISCIKFKITGVSALVKGVGGVEKVTIRSIKCKPGIIYI